MASLNKVMLIGNAGKDAELRYLANGTAQAQFSLAVNRSYKAPGNDSEWKEETEWFNIVAWAALAERLSQSVTKGKQLYVEGRLQTRTWDDDQGVKHYRTEVIANQVLQLERRERTEGGAGGGGGWNDDAGFSGRTGGGGPRGGGGQQPRGGGGSYSGGGGDTEVDDLPFE